MTGNMQNTVTEFLRELIKKDYEIDIDVVLTRPEAQFGDLATNVALQLAGRVGRKPQEVAAHLAKAVEQLNEIGSATVAGPGFINITLTDSALLDAWALEVPQAYRDKSVVVEYSDPNPFKILHAGHLYTSVMGDAIANLVEAAGAETHRVNFGGDVGMHVAKSMWAILGALGGENPEKLADIAADQRSIWLADRYVAGSEAFEVDVIAKEEITALNMRIYALHSESDNTSELARIYWETRQWSYDYFVAFYDRIGSHFDKFYPESLVADRGLKEVKSQIGRVFDESDGAVVFAGEEFGLHTRVFINREGLPTYEAKDTGLIFHKHDDYNFDKSIVVTGNEQEQYMAVVLKAIEQFAPELASRTTHLTHGLVKLAGGVKMSSRRGNFLRAVDVLNTAADANVELNQQRDERVSLGAVKYAFLRQRMGGDIIYDPNESVSLHGNSGPYLQYAHARACSIISKSTAKPALDSEPLDINERLLVRKLAEYQDVMANAVQDLTPHVICTYLFDLAQTFNRFYEKSRIIGDLREAARLELVTRYRSTLAHGLDLLSIAAPETL
ncbi:arginine--tRNA ligase [Patescibacteria group bacterium]|nr:MAG: arginine--tRNA ligase [Patescibacteria group bacterium]